MAMQSQDNMVVGGQAPTPGKFSRYRSVRRAASNNAQGRTTIHTAVPPAPTPASAPGSVSQDTAAWTTDTNTTIKKSMSRYRRQKTQSSNITPHVPPLPTSAGQPPPYRAQPPTTTRDNSSPPSSSSEEAEVAKVKGKLPSAMARDTRRKALLEGNDNTSSPNLSDREYEERERDRQDAMDRLTGGCDKAAASSSAQRPMTRGRAATNREVPKAEKKLRQAKEYSQRHSSNEPTRRSLREAMKFSRSKEKPKGESPSGSPVDAALNFPGIDAPISAVNAGERRVVVQYKKHAQKFTVTPSTSAQDILATASSCLSGEIEPRGFILLESFIASGLERPLRQYEYIREVMNSWGHDEENRLIIVPAASIDALALLDAQKLSPEQPVDTTFYIYYSHKPRKWDKRYVTLRSDGQITISKKEISKEQTYACHLSDFDIYSPTPTFLTRTVKPPKKLCHAVKSQQKSSMFITTENFIHFFATNDKSIAERFYRAVQSWRSWYLVNKLGAGQTESSSEHARSINQPQDNTSPVRTFKPLIDSIDYPSSDDRERPAEPPAERSRTQQLFARKRTSRDPGPPPSSFPKSLATEPDPGVQSTDGTPFSSSGLLGRTYTLRQKALKEREEREKRETDELFSQGLVGQSLAGNATSRRQASASRPGSRSNTMTSAHAPDTDGLIKRSQSLHQGKPLVDLTPVYQEPPQHIRKGRGVTVETGMPLIDAATGPEAPGGIVVPPAKTWRRPPAPAEPQPNPEIRTRNRSNTARSASSRYRHPNTAPASPAETPDAPAVCETPFAPNSLLARTGHQAPVQGAPIGHGVATGDRNATKPMLDMSDLNPFAEGSLLRGL
ncbi:hypothetical protein ARAM_007140 [Aspergillus rambellii]|uniref:PH domain-containing protein n=1 Tax=Aspergillus rambellii TaxID=308745 RepID=A0A0F8WHB3_9EURO|nr:hypothetical protein ARAM_007140 [Aspergillus rambellii]